MKNRKPAHRLRNKNVFIRRNRNRKHTFPADWLADLRQPIGDRIRY